MTRIKICGVRSVDQALACVAEGVDAVGVNFVPSSARCIDTATAAQIVRAVGGQALVVGVVDAIGVHAAQRLRKATGVGCLQLHGWDRSEDIEALLPHAYAAIPIRSAEDADLAGATPGEYVLADAKVDGSLGGTGRTFDWALVVGLARRRRLVLAGGLTPENVGRAVAQVGPWGVDVASGVESAPGVKDVSKVRAFVGAVRAASAPRSS
ncbi:MAG TPA: phosphoribosylanthranilate isomerase [Polyangiaceae bacterium]|nr:phosphoribosylanthranilate isomerase [Polyangiaceae bacterium]